MSKASWKRFIELCAILIICQTRHQVAATDDDDGDWREIVEEEDEIGYTQKLIVDVPPIASVQSSFQTIQVYDSDHWGRVLVLDDCLQLTVRDAAHYNEMMAHVPAQEYLARRGGDNDKQDPLKALVVGGGDGYVVSELLKYPEIASIDHVELDRGVVNVSGKHLPWGSVWENGRVNLVIADGAAFVKEQAKQGGTYNIIVQDASDPFWLAEDGTKTELPSVVLYDRTHFEKMYEMLAPVEGVLMVQAHTYNIPSNLESIRNMRKLLDDIGFEKPRYGSISIPTYPTGQIGFFAAQARGGKGEGVCKLDGECDDGATSSETFNEMDASPEIDWSRVLARVKKLEGKTLYYHPRIHRSSFDLPLWVEDYLYGDGDIPTFDH